MASLPLRAFWKVRSLIRRLIQFSSFLSPAYLLEDQLDRFKALGLERQESPPTSLWKGSEHWPLFRALAKNFEATAGSPRKILEIGTLDGSFTRELSELFPNSLITTIDLPSDVGFGNEYGWTDAETYVSERKKNLRGRKNINFVEANSLELTEWTETFDLIWVDGDHSLPTVAIDIANALRLVAKGGTVAIDDVFLKTPEPESPLASTGALRALESFHSAGVITDYSLVRKRLSPRKNLKWNTKFIAVVRASDNDKPSAESSSESSL